MYETVYVITIIDRNTQEVIHTDALTRYGIAAALHAYSRAELKGKAPRVDLSTTDHEYNEDITSLFKTNPDKLDAGEVLEHAARATIRKIVNEAKRDAEHYGNVIIDTDTSNDGEELIYISSPHAESVVIIVDVYNDFYMVTQTTNGEYNEPDHARYAIDTPDLIDQLRETVHDTTAQVHHHGCPSTWYEHDDHYL